MNKRYENITERIKTGTKSKNWWNHHPERKEEQSKKFKKLNHDHPERKKIQSEKMKIYWAGNPHPSAKQILLLSPQGQEYKILNYAKFCKEYNLSKQCICKVLQGKQKHHKGWVGKYL